MADLVIGVEEDPEKQDLESFWSILREHNEAQAGPANHRKLFILLRDDAGNIVGGLNGETYWGWLYVANLALSRSLRNQGLGKKLLEQAEVEAVNRGCKFAYLDTFSFQALPFYEKQGYAVFGVLEDYPEGKKRYFLQKRLVAVGA